MGGGGGGVALREAVRPNPAPLLGTEFTTNQMENFKKRGQNDNTSLNCSPYNKC